MGSPEVLWLQAQLDPSAKRRNVFLGLALSSASSWVNFNLGQAFHVAQLLWLASYPSDLPSSPSRNTAIPPHSSCKNSRVNAY